MFASARQILRKLTGPRDISPAIWQCEKAYIRMAACAESLQDQKKALRKAMKARLRHMSAEDMQAESTNLLDPAHAGSLTAQSQACTHARSQPAANLPLQGCFHLYMQSIHLSCR